MKIRKNKYINLITTELSIKEPRCTEEKNAVNDAKTSLIAKDRGVSVSPAEIMKLTDTQTAKLTDAAEEGVTGGTWGDTGVRDTESTKSAGTGALAGRAAIAGAVIK